MRSESKQVQLRRQAVLERVAVLRSRTGRRYPCVVLDGGFATELERMGHDLSAGATGGEWSAAIVRTAPDDVQRVHERFLEAGADILTCATYQASTETIPAAVKLLGQAIDRMGIDTSAVLRAASLGPLAASLGGGQEYRGYADTSVFANGTEAARCEFRRFHETRLRQCLPFLEETSSEMDRFESGAVSALDLVLFETIPDAVEAETITLMMAHEPAFENIPWAISLQCRPPQTGLEAATPSEPRLAGGGPVSNVVDHLLSLGFGRNAESDTRNGPLFIGFNCCPPSLIRPILESLHRCIHPLARQLTQPRSPVATRNDASTVAVSSFAGWAVYPNSGEVWDPSTKRWGRAASAALDPSQESFWQHHVPEWCVLGASIIGGCCRVGPEAILALTRVVHG